MIAEKIKRARNRLQRIVDLMGNDSGHPSHRRQPLCLAKGILCFQLGGNVPVDLEDCISPCLERLPTCDAYFLAVASHLGEVPIPLTGLLERALDITKSMWEPGLENLVDRFAQNLLASPAIE